MLCDFACCASSTCSTGVCELCASCGVWKEWDVLEERRGGEGDTRRKWDLTSERRPPHRMQVARPVGVRLGDGATLRKRKASRRVSTARSCVPFADARGVCPQRCRAHPQGNKIQ